MSAPQTSRLAPQTTAFRLVGLLGIAVVSVAAALALTHKHHDSGLPEASGRWYTALAAPYRPSASRQPTRSACGVVIGPKTKGVAHPTLPCGVKVYIAYQGKEALTQVIDRGPNVPGREFDVTQALANELGLVGTRAIRWRYTTGTTG